MDLITVISFWKSEIGNRVYISGSSKSNGHYVVVGVDGCKTILRGQRPHERLSEWIRRRWDRFVHPVKRLFGYGRAKHEDLKGKTK